MQMKGIQTNSIHGAEYKDSNFNAIHLPIYQTVIFEQPGTTHTSDRGKDLKYSREENPTVRALEHVLSKIEHGRDALVFSSGMGALSAIYLALVEKRNEILLSMEGYGTTIELAEDLERKFDVNVNLASPETSSIIEDINEDTKLVLLESITNPTLKVFDIPEIAKRCKEVDTILVIDNTFATPVLYNPLKSEADYVVHSLTKYLAGHNDVIGGAIIGKDLETFNLWDWRRKLGSIIQPLESFLITRGLKTLELRVKKHCENAQAVAEFLYEHPKVKEVLYPGLSDSPYHRVAKKLFGNLFGGVVSFKIKGKEEEVRKVLNTLKLVFPSPSLGGPESLISWPIISAAKNMPKERREVLGITGNLLRLSVGLENLEDIIEDLDRALNSIGGES